MRRKRLALAFCALVAGLGACGVDAESNTGLLVVVTLDDSAVVDGTATPLDRIRFYVATKKPGTEIFVLNEELVGRPVDVEGRDLKADPYLLFLASSVGGAMETLKIVVVGEKGSERRLFGALVDPDTQTLEEGVILERTIALKPSSNDMGLTWTTTGCLLSADGTIRFGSLTDRDCDGHVAELEGGDDCDDEDPRVNPAMLDNDCDGIDNDCKDGIDPTGDLDVDGDGVSACNGDCKDDNPYIYPGAEEICDGVDNNCNDQCDEGKDEDGDGYTECGSLISADGKTCTMVQVGDCDPQNPDVHPGAEDVCNGVDDNCNGYCDEGTDTDHDGFNECGTLPGAAVVSGSFCVEPSPERIDCAPEDPAIYPTAREVCDGYNNDCNIATTPPLADCFVTEGSQGIGRCVPGVSTCTEGEGSYEWGECLYDSETAQAVSPAFCAGWTLCSQSPDPAACMASSVESSSMECKVHMTTVTLGGPCAEDPPTYYLPFGVSLLTGCTWTLQVDFNTPGWQTLGLVDPYAPASPAARLNSCDAALVARPMPLTGGTLPEALAGTISLVYLDGSQSVLLVLHFILGADYDCAAGSSLTCNISPP